MKFNLVIISISIFTTQLTFAAAHQQSVMIGYEHRNYSKDRGDRNLAFLQYGNKFDQGAIVTRLTHGERDFGSGKSDTGVEGKFDLYYHWNDYLTTKTGITLSDNTSTFAHNEYRQDFNIKPIKDLVISLGGKHTNYENNIEVNSWTSGLTWYTKRSIISYKYTNYSSDEKGDSYGNTFSAKLKDKSGTGSTQLWLGFGTGAYSYEWDPNNLQLSGDFKSATLRREQAISKNWQLGLAAGRNWYETPIENYNSLNGQIDFTYKW